MAIKKINNTSKDIPLLLVKINFKLNLAPRSTTNTTTNKQAQAQTNLCFFMYIIEFPKLH